MAPGQLWRLTRNRYSRALYEWLAERGLRVSVLLEYRRPAEALSVDEPGAVEIREQHPDSIAEYRDETALSHSDLVLGAYRDGERVGSLLVGLDRSIPVAPLERRFDPAGGYLWRLWVDAPARGRGIGTALVRAGVGATAERDLANAVALVARDNLPSRRAFAASGFEPPIEHRYLSVAGWTRSRTVRR
jgi:ribosomal protein S18 acetylase RimI-like enzyme